MTENTNYKTLVGVVIQAEVDGSPRNELVLELGPTPESILRYCPGFDNLEMVLKARNLGKMFFDHAMKKGVIERLPEILASPKALYQSVANAGMTAAVVMTFESQNGSPIIIPIHANKQIGRRMVNEVASMYAKTGPDPEVKWKEQGLLLWRA